MVKLNRKVRRERERRKTREIKKLRKKRTTINFSKGISMSNGGLGNSVVDGCVANILANCRGKLSREHYISKSILEQIGPIEATGVPFLRELGVKGQIPPRNLTVNKFCEGHNNYLSDLDKHAGNLFKELSSWDENKNIKAIFSGVLFEKWVLKLLIGILATGQIKYKKKVYNSNSVNILWYKILYENEKIPDGCGLYAFHKEGDSISIVDILTHINEGDSKVALRNT